MHWLLGCPDDTRRIEKRAFTAQWLEADMVWKALGVALGVLRMIYKQFRYQGSDKGGSCAEDFDRYKTQSIRPASTKLDAWSHFCNYKIQSKTGFDFENN